MNAIHPAPAEFSKDQLTANPILRYFHYKHLPEPLQSVSSAFYTLAVFIVDALPQNAERTVALRKLLEAKDAGVRANVGTAATIEQRFPDEARLADIICRGPAPDTFFTRLLAEEKELGERLDKLDAFIISDAFRAVDFDQRKLLQHQALVMNNYRDLLQKRIALATKVLDTPAEELGEVKITGGGSVEDPIPFKG